MFLVNWFRGMAHWAEAHRPGWPGLLQPQRRLRHKPSPIQGSLFVFLAALTSVFVWLVGFTSAGDEHDRRPQTFTVLVGAEDADVGAAALSFFPNTVTIHVGDTVHWVRNTNEVHTVSFMAGTPLPPVNIPAPPGSGSPLQRNPLVIFPTVPANGQYDGTTYANSGIFGIDPDIYQGVQSFDLTFTREGTFPYVCLVHGVPMSGQIIVVDRRQHIRSPRAVAQEARRLMDEAVEDVLALFPVAEAEVPAPTQNDDGTTTFYVNVGFSVDNMDLVAFFPNELTVHPGDTVVWQFAMEDVAPHTITFLNGNEDPPDLIVVPQPPPQPPLILVNPDFLFPHNEGEPLTRDGIFSSGRLAQDNPPPSYSLTIGDITGDEPYKCLIHDASGMTGMLHIVPR
jgi:plastocyanin